MVDKCFIFEISNYIVISYSIQILELILLHLRYKQANLKSKDNVISNIFIRVFNIGFKPVFDQSFAKVLS